MYILNVLMCIIVDKCPLLISGMDLYDGKEGECIMKENRMEKIQEWNKKYQVWVGTLIATIIGIMFGIGRHIDFNSLGVPSNYRFNLDAPVNSRLWLVMVLYIGCYHLYRAYRNGAFQGKQASTKIYMNELIEFSLITSIEIMLMYLLYLIIGFGNIFAVIPVYKLLLLIGGICVSGVIVNLLFYILLVAIGDLKKAILVGMISLLVIININANGIEIGGIGYNTSRVVSPTKHAMEYDRLVYHYYTLDGEVSEIDPDMHADFPLILMVQLTWITGLSYLGYTLTKKRQVVLNNTVNSDVQTNVEEIEESKDKVEKTEVEKTEVEETEVEETEVEETEVEETEA